MNGKAKVKVKINLAHVTLAHVQGWFGMITAPLLQITDLTRRTNFSEMTDEQKEEVLLMVKECYVYGSVEGFASALKNEFRKSEECQFRVPPDIEASLNQLTKSYLRKEKALKDAGVLCAKEGKVYMKIDGYKLLCQAFLNMNMYHDKSNNKRRRTAGENDDGIIVDDDADDDDDDNDNNSDVLSSVSVEDDNPSESNRWSIRNAVQTLSSLFVAPAANHSTNTAVVLL